MVSNDEEVRIAVIALIDLEANPHAGSHGSRAHPSQARLLVMTPGRGLAILRAIYRPGLKPMALFASLHWKLVYLCCWPDWDAVDVT